MTNLEFLNLIKMVRNGDQEAWEQFIDEISKIVTLTPALAKSYFPESILISDQHKSDFVQYFCHDFLPFHQNKIIHYWITELNKNRQLNIWTEMANNYVDVFLFFYFKIKENEMICYNTIRTKYFYQLHQTAASMFVKSGRRLIDNYIDSIVDTCIHDTLRKKICPANLRAYLIKSCVTGVQRELKKRRLNDPIENHGDIPDQNISPETAVENKQKRELIIHALQRLSPECFNSVIFELQEQMEYLEYALQDIDEMNRVKESAVFKITDNTIKKLQQNHLPEGIIQKLELHKNIEYESREGFRSALKNILGSNDLLLHQKMIFKFVAKREPIYKKKMGVSRSDYFDWKKDECMEEFKESVKNLGLLP